MRHRTLGLAAETAFWLFLSLVPLAAVAGLVAARVTLRDWNRFSPVLSALPRAARPFVASELKSVSRWNGGTVGVSSALVFVWLASSGVDALFGSIEAVSGAARSWWRRRGLALGACALLSIAVALLAFLGPGLGSVLVALERVLPDSTLLERVHRVMGPIVRFVLALAVGLGYVATLYFIGVPRAARIRMPIFPGAAFAVAMQFVTSFGYSAYLSKVGTTSAYTAGLGIIGLVLMGLYLFSLSLLTGVLVNRFVAERALRARPAEARSPGGGSARSAFDVPRDR
ncbi:MAG TPA: YhjD/YihY/BrkB family envelope integrity protein [Polyangiaceae bacterium]|nr:YhjD/YihY/BrkB family envelope integrity protein [Polyangiaceae bacterium]